MKIGLVTIGQAPRPDLLRPMQRAVKTSAELVLTGALDDLTIQEVTQLAPTHNDETLVTLMRDGRSVKITKDSVVPLLQQRINEHEKNECDVIVVLCTGAFPQLSVNVPILMPDRVLHHFSRGIFPEGKLGVIVPAAEQIDEMHEKWVDYPDCTMDSLDPYGDGAASGLNTNLADCGLVVLDCMGYTNKTKSKVQSQLGVPVIVAQEVLASAVELLV